MLNLLLAALTGLLLVLIHPRFDLVWLAPAATLPLVAALAREWRPRHRFLLGYVAGVIFWGGVCYWIHYVMSVHGQLGPVGGAAVFVLFCALKGIHLGLFGLGAGVLIHRRWAIVSVPALWVIVERVPDPFGFMWLHLGNAGITMGLPLRLAPITGVYGLSFVFAAMGTAFALGAMKRPRAQIAPVLALLFLGVLPALPDPEAGTDAAIAVQPNVSGTEQWDANTWARFNAALQSLSLEPMIQAQRRPSLILWPEVPAPVYYDEDPALRERVAAMARIARTHVLLGTVAYNERRAPLNAALMVSPDGKSLGRYDKMLLVPFGEYIPFPFGAVATTITKEIGDFVPGERIVTFSTGAQTVGAFICYESAFPHLVRRFADEGATLLANLSNDGYFGGGAAREQHLNLVRMRAAENGRWIVRATNDGITASVDPAGRVLHPLPQFEQTSGLLPYRYRSDTTLYSRAGDWFAALCGVLACVFLVESQVPRYRAERARHGGKHRPV